MTAVSWCYALVRGRCGIVTVGGVLRDQPFIAYDSLAGQTLTREERVWSNSGTEPEVIVVQYGRGCWTRGQKFALIRTVCLCVRTLISRSVTATKTGQTPTESHVKRIKLLR